MPLSVAEVIALSKKGPLTVQQVQDIAARDARNPGGGAVFNPATNSWSQPTAAPTPTKSTAPLGSTQRTNDLLAEASQQTGIPAQTFVDSPSTAVSATSRPVDTALAERGETPGVKEFAGQSDFEKFLQNVQPLNKPAPINYVSEFQRLQGEHDIPGIESKLSANRAEQDTLKRNLEAFKRKETEGQSLGFALGRMTEEERNVADRQQILLDEERNLTERYNMRNKTIETTMNLLGKGYDDARHDYEFEFSRNLQIYTAVKNEEEKKIAGDRAAYQTFVNLFSASGKSLEDVSPAMLRQINELELKQGLPVGSFEALARAKPGADVLKSGTSNDADGNEFAWFITEKDGIPEVVTIGTGGFKESASDKKEATEADRKAEFSKMRQFIIDNPGQSRESLRATMMEQAEFLTDSDINAILDEGGSKPFLSVEYFGKLFTDDQLKESASEAGYRHVFTSWATEKQNYLEYLMQLVEQYRQQGYTDKDILAKMK